ncbi:MAG TPA: hypothetical protein PKC21_06855 [Oligoflexia bacterium]|nr:hypothetical protein [Oligoflexia bacterium]HMR25056.1 hypothetical protein [Oligoflexia bacterium]
MKQFLICCILFSFYSGLAQNIQVDPAKTQALASRLEMACSAGNEISNQACLEQLELMLNKMDLGTKINLSSVIASICQRYAMPYNNELEKPLTTLYKLGFLSRQVSCLESCFHIIGQEQGLSNLATFHLQHCAGAYEKQNQASIYSKNHLVQAYLSCIYKSLDNFPF